MIVAVVMIGLSAGLRALTPPAVLAWAAYLGYIDLTSTPFALAASPVIVAIATVLAIGEYVWDLLPFATDRTELPALIARILSGTCAAACLLLASHGNLILCLIGGATAIAGAYGGYQLRVRLVEAMGVSDAVIAIPEDLVAIGMSVAAAMLVRSSMS